MVGVLAPIGHGKWMICMVQIHIFWCSGRDVLHIFPEVIPKRFSIGCCVLAPEQRVQNTKYGGDFSLACPADLITENASNGHFQGSLLLL